MKGGSTHTVQALISLKEAIISISVYPTSHCKWAVLLGNTIKDSMVKASIPWSRSRVYVLSIVSPQNANLISGFFLLNPQNHNLSTVEHLLLFFSKFPDSV